jgi:hypothetical protein
MVRTVVGIAIGLGVLAVAQPVAAQSQDVQRGERGVEVLGLQVGTTVSTGDLPGEAPFPGAVDLPQVNSRYHSDISAAMRFRPIPGERANYGFNVQSAVRRFEDSEEFTVLGHSAGGNLGLRVGRRLVLSGYAAASYLPSYGLNMTPNADLFAPAAAAVEAGQLSRAAAAAGLLPSSAVDYSLTKRTLMSLGGGGTVDYTLTRRLALQMGYQQTRQEFRRDDDPDLRSQYAAGRLTYRLNRLLGLRLGFQRRYADYVTPTGVETTVLDDIDVGLDSGYGRQVNLTRSTTLSFNTGSTITHRDGSPRAQLTGAAYLVQRIGRRGQASLGATRGAELREGFDEPVFSNSVVSDVRFAFPHNFSMSVNGLASVGELLRTRVQTTSDHVRTYQASARLAYGFLRRGQVYGQYLLAGHDIGTGVGVIEGVARTGSYRSVRVGVQWSVTLASQRPSPGQSAPAQGDN